MYSNEKLGRAEREAKQMEDFRDCLNRCGLVDLGFFGKKFTWCNRRFGDSRTKLRLDRMVANEDWMRHFPKARVFHSAMSISDHCLLKLSLNKGRNWVKPKKRFMFKAMWTGDNRCREVVEMAWDSVSGNPEFELADKLRCCKENLHKWNWQEFGNVKHTIKQKQEKLQHLESLNSLHNKVKEVQKLKTDINKALTREEIMWS